MAKRDWLRECNDQNVPPQEFHQIFCVRCRNPDCTRAGYAGSLWTNRITTQVERLLENPLFADLSMPQYAKVNALDFPDALRQALRIEIANKRKDWEVPPEDLTPEQAMRELAALPDKQEPATRAASLSVTMQEDTLQEDTLQEDTVEAPDVPAVAPEVSRAAPQAAVLATLPARTNTAFPVGGIMLDGSRRTSMATPMTPEPPKVIVDPWAVPAPVENVVPVGAKIRLGLSVADASKKDS